MKFENGKMYLIEERVPLRAHQILRKELARGRPALYISKHSPNLIATQFINLQEPLTTKWLSPRPEENCIPPMNLAMFEKYLEEFITKNEDGIVVLNGLDVLEKWNGFSPVFKIIKRAQERVSGSCCKNIIISLDPKSHFDKQLAALENISDEVLVSQAEA